MKENAATLWEIDALWLTLHSHFASTTEFHSVALALTASAALGKQSAKKNIILSNSTFYNLSIHT